ncbi:MAG TPA: hypothetical protein VMS93_08635 [Candidatus Saccharimonadales bacterium]|nr:hypothetical protein [Candidatus Saccharimonadales bacterium]
MSKFVRIALMVALGVVMAVGISAAAVPDPGNSVIGTCLAFAPGGELLYTVTVNDQFGNPINNVAVDIDLTSCSAVQVCSGQDAGFTATGKVIEGHTNGSGVVTFTARAGGICQSVPGDGPIRIWAGGVKIGELTTNTSMDLDGSLDLGLIDFSDFVTDESALPPNLESDFDCDGTVGLLDLSLFATSEFLQPWHGFCP